MPAQIQNEKYEAILQTAHDLFWKFGIRRVTVEEVCKEAGVSKMTFYRYFSNKNDLAKEVIEKMFSDMYTGYRSLMDQDIPFEEKVKQQLMMKFEGTNEISAELVKDIYGDPGSELFSVWKSRADKIVQVVLDDYKEAQKKGWIRQDLNVEFILYMSNKTVQIASDPQAQAMYPDMQSLIMEIANMFFYGIMPRNIVTK
ncbi:MAG: TetR/AcrR family transcriptional regulator [Bacteroidales bacterium]|nr:TetR/AcrR family transcriptional regulator [Bacteroidales bacterium]